MRSVRGIVVHRAILHLVAPKGQGLVLSDQELDVQSNRDLETFFKKHVAQSLKDGQLRAALFDRKEEGTPYHSCQQILLDPTSFVDESHNLGSQLFAAMGSDRRISDGTLAVLLYSAFVGTDESSYVALLKLDPSDAFRPVVEEAEDGQRIVRLELTDNVMPTARERLHKSAFIRPEAPGTRYDLLLLDRQVEADFARFFGWTFLRAVPALDARQRTATFFAALERALRTIGPSLNASDHELFNGYLFGARRASQIDLEQLIDSAPLPASARESFRESLDGLVDRVFRLDEEERARSVQTRKFFGDNGLVVRLDAEHYDRMVSLEDVPNTSGTLRRVIIETEKWDEKL